jgi:eukaryotic-like serine/threonine-protein kinase
VHVVATIHCPNCQHEIALTGVKPGHYHPSCPTCRQKFDLLIPKAADEPARVTKLVAIQTAVQTAAPATIAPVISAPYASAPQAIVRTPASANNVTAMPGRVDRSEYFIGAAPTIAYDDLHGRLGGYQIVQKLGQGGMGSVYLARQLSLDRDVALKTLSPTLANDPAFVARFTREAYAAAQLSHHNVVQIHDIGQDKGTSFFSMERVEGTNLAALVQREGRLDPLTAVNYTLQAARGLQFAHDHGLIHRDVKPENLLLSTEGIVKVADLGLVKLAGTDDAPALAPPAGQTARGNVMVNAATGNTTTGNATMVNASMGTPAYMAPEQARDAAKVDHRADIYSLGCTLYDLVTGRPPFSGKSAIEVLTKHQTQPITPPEKIVANLPRRLSEIISRMTSKQPDARYPTMAAVVKDLEEFLGVADDGASGVRSTQEHIKRIEVSVAQFNAAPVAQIRRNLILAFYVLCLICLGVGALTFSPRMAGGAVAFAVLSTLAYQLTIGLRQRTVLFSKLRQLVFGASVGDWATWLLGVVLAIALLYFFGQLWIWVAVAVLAVFVGITFHLGVDAVVAIQREDPLKQADAVIREMRTRGVDEDGIRGLIARFSGARWEEFYEALFGYDAKILARRLYGKGERGKDRKRFGVWRDWLIAWIDQKLEDRKSQREQRLLARLESRALEARGVLGSDATRQARETAARVVSGAKSMKDAPDDDRRFLETVEPSPARQPTAFVRPEWLDEPDDAPNRESQPGYVKTGYLRRRFGGPLDVLLGRRVRFILAALLLLGSGKWVQLNGVANALEEFREVGESAQRISLTLQQTAETAIREGKVAPRVETPAPASQPTDDTYVRPLEVPGVPAWVTSRVGSWNGLVSGVLLLISVPLWGHLMSLSVIAGSVVSVFGIQYDLPVIGAAPAWLAMAAGGLISLGGMLFFRRTDM